MQAFPHGPQAPQVAPKHLPGGCHHVPLGHKLLPGALKYLTGTRKHLLHLTYSKILLHLIGESNRLPKAPKYHLGHTSISLEMGSTSLGTPELLWGAGAPPWVIQVCPQGTQARKHFPGGPMHLLSALKHLTMDALKTSPTPQKHLLGEVRILPQAPNHLPWAPKYIL